MSTALCQKGLDLTHSSWTAIFQKLNCQCRNTWNICSSIERASHLPSYHCSPNRAELNGELRYCRLLERDGTIRTTPFFFQQCLRSIGTTREYGVCWHTGWHTQGGKTITAQNDKVLVFSIVPSFNIIQCVIECRMHWNISILLKNDGERAPLIAAFSGT